METEKIEKRFYTKSELKERGWTDASIKKFLGDPDETIVNPRYKCAAPMCLYIIERVDLEENKDEFKKFKEKSEKRSKSLKNVADKKRKEVLDYLDKLIINIPKMKYNKLVNKACDSYNSWNCFRDDFRPATKDSDEKFLKRICTNYLRHNCSIYEKELEKLFGKVGVQEGHVFLYNKINDKIRELYPELKEDGEEE